MSVISGQRLASLTNETLEKIRSDQDFDHFYELILKKPSAISGIDKPELPRKQIKPNYSLLQYFGDRRKASNSVNAYYQSSAHQHFRVIYFEAIDSVVSAIKGRLEQLCFSLFSDLEQLLLKSINGEDSQQELDNFRNISTYLH